MHHPASRPIALDPTLATAADRQEANPVADLASLSPASD